LRRLCGSRFVLRLRRCSGGSHGRAKQALPLKNSTPERRAFATRMWYVSVMPRLDECAVAASHALLSAALGGLLCVASSSCGSSTGSSTSAVSTGASSSSSSAGSSMASSAGATSTGAASTGASSSTGSATQATASTDIDTPIPDTECDGGVSPTPQVTSSTVGALTEDQFTSMCAAQNGIFELQPHCSGSNACRGMSYWSENQTLIQHTCRAQNSCAGYSCVICD
jgi:hypothetical protein